MKLKFIIKHTFIILRNVILLLLLLEFSLGAYYTLKTWRAKQAKINTVANSNLYYNLKKDTVKIIFKELYNQDMHWESYTHYGFKPFNGKYNTINANGQRQTLNFNKKTDKKTYKIFCFGGSTLYGSGARNNYTIPSELSKLIANNFAANNIEITNFGCHGYIRSMENIALQKQLLVGNIPDMVIFYDGINDVVSAFQNNKAGLPSNSINRKEEFNNAISYGNRLQFILKKTYIYTTILSLTKQTISSKTSTQKLANAVVKNYIGNVTITNALSKTYNFKVFNFIQPHLYTKTNTFGIEKQAYKDTEYYKPLFSETYKSFNKRLQKTPNIAIDLSTAFNRYKQPFYYDFCHTNETGNAIIAKEIYKVIHDCLLKIN